MAWHMVLAATAEQLSYLGRAFLDPANAVVISRRMLPDLWVELVLLASVIGIASASFAALRRSLSAARIFTILLAAIS